MWGSSIHSRPVCADQCACMHRSQEDYVRMFGIDELMNVVHGEGSILTMCARCICMVLSG